MKRSAALDYVSFVVDDALSERSLEDMPDNAVLVGWQCGFEPLFVAVFSYLPNSTVWHSEAMEIATEFLQERRWFTDNDNPPEPDYVL